ncbi:hypothetical protein D8T43_21285, partial [Vibrio vulnificus]|uniref:RHS repeat domain-containing protein n=1 Tax=Vibrio vulnificus TaxID=672 RepID=UPI0010D0951D
KEAVASSIWLLFFLLECDSKLTHYHPNWLNFNSDNYPARGGNDGFPTADYSKSSILDVPIDPEPSSYNENYGVVTLDYDVLGNITHKSDVGSYRYDGVKPHAVSAVSGKTHSSFTYDAQGNMLSGLGRVITGYTSFNKPIEIRKGNASTRFQYGVNQQRYERIDRNENGVTQTIYLDSTEIIKQPNGQTTFRYYIGDFAIFEKTVGKASSSVIRYLHKDHLGSVIAISNQNGEIEERFSYDAWGKRRSSSWNKPDTSTSEVGRIGFTGHEMLDEVGLIHMNGRVYDPTIGRFLSADPFIQDEWFATQAFNRYSYVQNNPLSYTDPTGYYVPKDTSESSTSSEQERNDYRQYERDRDRDRDRNEVANTQAEVGYGNHSAFIAGYNQPRDPEAAAIAASMLLGGGAVAIGAKLARPFLGRAFGWASSKIKKVLGFGDEAADVTKRTVSKIDDITKPGSKLPNIKTDVPKSEFEKNLMDNGFTKSTSKDGSVNIFTNGDKKYTTRDFSKSTDGPTAEVFKNNQPTSKIRLGDE